MPLAVRARRTDLDTEPAGPKAEHHCDQVVGCGFSSGAKCRGGNLTQGTAAQLGTECSKAHRDVGGCSAILPAAEARQGADAGAVAALPTLMHVFSSSPGRAFSTTGWEWVQQSFVHLRSSSNTQLRLRSSCWMGVCWEAALASHAWHYWHRLLLVRLPL